MGIDKMAYKAYLYASHSSNKPCLIDILKMRNTLASIMADEAQVGSMPSSRTQRKSECIYLK